MFEKDLVYYTKPQPPRNVPKVSYYINQLTIRRDEAFERNKDHVGYDTRGMELLRYILANADVPGLLSIPDQMDRFTYGVDPMLSILTRIFDPAYIGVHNFASFVQSDSVMKGVDYLIPCEPENPFMAYPFGKGWDVWSNLCALRLIDIDAHELTLNAYMDVLKFKKSKPGYALFSLDVGALVMQYSVYLSETKPEDRMLLADYLHRYVIYPCLIGDSPNLWLLNLYDSMLSSEDYVPDQELTSIYGMLGSGYAPCIWEVSKMIKDVGKNTLLPPVFLSSLLLTDHQTVTSYYHTLHADVSLPPLRQYRWMEFLRDYKLLRIIVKTAQLQLDNPNYSFLHTNLKRDFSLFYMSHPWTDIKNPRLRGIVEDKVSDPVFDAFL